MRKTIRRIAITGELNEFIKGRIAGMITGVLCNLEGEYIYDDQGNTVTFYYDATDKQHSKICGLLLQYSEICKKKGIIITDLYEVLVAIKVESK